MVEQKPFLFRVMFDRLAQFVFAPIVALNCDIESSSLKRDAPLQAKMNARAEKRKFPPLRTTDNARRKESRPLAPDNDTISGDTLLSHRLTLAPSLPKGFLTPAAKRDRASQLGPASAPGVACSSAVAAASASAAAPAGFTLEATQTSVLTAGCFGSEMNHPFRWGVNLLVCQPRSEVQVCRRKPGEVAFLLGLWRPCRRLGKPQ